jgi:predicted nuclease of restriction endonuclease-like (RecB) superfamily
MSDQVPASHRHGEVALPAAYGEALAAIKQQIQAAHVRAVQAVNRELVMLYWAIGREILTRQEAESWGSSVIERLAADLRTAFPGQSRGFSRRNLFYMRRFAELWPDEGKVQSLIALIGWTHQIQLLNAFGNDPGLYEWYAAQAAEHRWSVRRLQGEIDTRLHERLGAATSNFAQVLPAEQAEDAQVRTKDPYNLDFVLPLPGAQERHLEQALINDIQKFILELGRGFAFCGNQYPLGIGEQEFFLDLLFYHFQLRRFVVIDLKMGRFEAEFAGKMSLYLNAVDDQLRHSNDLPSIGIIVCTDHDETVASLALRSISSPIAISRWTPDSGSRRVSPPAELTESVPDEMEEELAGIEDVKRQLEDHVAQRAHELEEEMGTVIEGQADEIPDEAASPGDNSLV